MGLLKALVDVILPVLVVTLAGAFLGRRFEVSPAVLSKITLHVLTPALAFQTIAGTKVSVGDGAAIVVGYLITAALSCGLGWLLGMGTPQRTRRAVMASVTIGNNGNMGLPIALFALGQAGFDQSVILFLASIVLTFVIGPLLYGGHETPRQAILGIARLPVLWAMALAVGLRLTGLHLPLGVTRGVDLLAQATLTMILLTLGIQLGSSGRVSLTRPVVTGALARVLAVPVLSIGVGLAIGMRGLPLQSLFLASAMPTAVNAFLLAHEYDGDTKTVADIVTADTVLSFGTLAVVVAVLPHLPG